MALKNQSILKLTFILALVCMGSVGVVQSNMHLELAKINVKQIYDREAHKLMDFADQFLSIFNEFENGLDKVLHNAPMNKEISQIASDATRMLKSSVKEHISEAANVHVPSALQHVLKWASGALVVMSAYSYVF